MEPLIETKKKKKKKKKFELESMNVSRTEIPPPDENTNLLKVNASPVKKESLMKFQEAMHKMRTNTLTFQS